MIVAGESDAAFTRWTPARTLHDLSFTAYAGIGSAARDRLTRACRHAASTYVPALLRRVVPPARAAVAAGAVTIDVRTTRRVETAHRVSGAPRFATRVILARQRCAFGAAHLRYVTAPIFERATRALGVLVRRATALGGAHLVGFAPLTGRPRVAVDQGPARGVDARRLAELLARQGGTRHGRTLVRCLTAARLTARTLAAILRYSTSRVEPRAAQPLFARGWGANTLLGLEIASHAVFARGDAFGRTDELPVEVTTEQQLTAECRQRNADNQEYPPH